MFGRVICTRKMIGGQLSQRNWMGVMTNELGTFAMGKYSKRFVCEATDEQAVFAL